MCHSILAILGCLPISVFLHCIVSSLSKKAVYFSLDLLGVPPAPNNGTHGSLNHLLKSPPHQPVYPAERSAPSTCTPVSETPSDPRGCTCDSLTEAEVGITDIIQGYCIFLPVIRYVKHVHLDRFLQGRRHNAKWLQYIKCNYFTVHSYSKTNRLTAPSFKRKEQVLLISFAVNVLASNQTLL